MSSISEAVSEDASTSQKQKMTIWKMSSTPTVSKVSFEPSASPKLTLDREHTDSVKFTEPPTMSR